MNRGKNPQGKKGSGAQGNRELDKSIGTFIEYISYEDYGARQKKGGHKPPFLEFLQKIS